MKYTLALFALLLPTTSSAGSKVIQEGIAATNTTIFVDTTNIRVGIITATPAVALDVNGSLLVRSTATVQGNAFSVGTASFTVSGGSATVVYQLTVGEETVNRQLTVVGTETVKGNAFSVGASSFTVSGGSATVAYQMTIGAAAGIADPRLYITGPTAKIWIRRQETDTSGAPTTSATDIGGSYMQLGGNEYGLGSLRVIGFGYLTQSKHIAPAYMGYVERNTVGTTNGDLIFATRPGTTETEPVVNLQILAQGNATFTGAVTSSQSLVATGAGGIVAVTGPIDAQATGTGLRVISGSTLLQGGAGVTVTYGITAASATFGGGTLCSTCAVAINGPAKGLSVNGTIEGGFVMASSAAFSGNLSSSGTVSALGTGGLLVLNGPTGLGIASPAASIQLAIKGINSNTSVEIGNLPSTLVDHGFIQSYDRTASLYRVFDVRASSVNLTYGQASDIGLTLNNAGDVSLAHNLSVTSGVTAATGTFSGNLSSSGTVSALGAGGLIVTNNMNAGSVTTSSLTVGGYNQGVWYAWTPTYAGFSADPTAVYSRFMVLGKTVFAALQVNALGTSNATTFTVTLPVAAKQLQDAPCVGFDNSAGLSAPALLRTRAGSATADVYRDYGAAAWTGSGTKGAGFNFSYEAN